MSDLTKNEMDRRRQVYALYLASCFRTFVLGYFRRASMLYFCNSFSTSVEVVLMADYEHTDVHLWVIPASRADTCGSCLGLPERAASLAYAFPPGPERDMVMALYAEVSL